MSATPLVPELEGYHRELEDLKKRAQALVAGLSEAQFTWRPGPGRWSIGECLTHLNVTAEKMVPNILAAIARGRARGLLSAGPYRHGRIGAWFVRSMEPPARRRFRTSRVFEPAPGQPLAAVVPAFLAAKDHVIVLLAEANGLDLGRIKVTSPVSRFFRYSLGQAFAALAAHERRHLWQAEQVKGAPGFPGASGRGVGS